MSRINTVDKQLCCGCGACAVVCPTQCINLVADEEGFDYPTITEANCIDCGKCLSVCGMQNEPQLNDVKETYAAWHKDPKIRALGTSGSAFTALAQVVLNCGGVVVGARFSDDFSYVYHYVVEDYVDLAPMRGAKYVQSQTLNSFRDTITVLEQGKQVLFTGTPCQVASLRKLAKPLDQNLLTCDLVCHGVPSSLVFSSYVKEIEDNTNERLAKYSFRDKCLGWNIHRIRMESASGNSITCIPWLDRFSAGYYLNVFLRPCCYSCPFTRKQRAGDLTLADCWRVASSHPQYDDNKGTSLVLANTTKGQKILLKAKSKDLLFLGEYDLNLASSRNEPLTKPAKRSPYREGFFEAYLENQNFQKASDVYMQAVSNAKKRIQHLVKIMLWPILRKFL